MIFEDEIVKKDKSDKSILTNKNNTN